MRQYMTRENILTALAMVILGIAAAIALILWPPPSGH